MTVTLQSWKRTHLQAGRSLRPERPSAKSNTPGGAAKATEQLSSLCDSKGAACCLSSLGDSRSPLPALCHRLAFFQSELGATNHGQIGRDSQMPRSPMAHFRQHGNELV